MNLGRQRYKPHLKLTFKLSNDPNFEERLWDVVGLYLDPPDKTLVPCRDEKSQVQALERTQPGLPLEIGHIRTQSHVISATAPSPCSQCWTIFEDA